MLLGPGARGAALGAELVSHVDAATALVAETSATATVSRRSSSSTCSGVLEVVFLGLVPPANDVVRK